MPFKQKTWRCAIQLCCVARRSRRVDTAILWTWSHYCRRGHN